MSTADRQRVIALLRRAHARLTDALDAGAWDDETQELADLANDLGDAARAAKARREHNGLRAEIERLRAERAAMLRLIGDLADGDDCWFDHHGGCQAHGYLSLEPGEKCPHQEAKELLEASKGGEQR